VVELFFKPSLFLKRSCALVLLLLWMAVIFTFSSLPGKQTDGPPPLWYFIERKGAHVFEYALLMLLAFRFFRYSFSQEKMTLLLLLAATFSLVYGVTDELHQFFVPLRGARMPDVFIDGLGILFMTTLLFLTTKKSLPKE